MANKSFYVSVESFKVSKESDGSVKLSGLALPIDKVSRNKFSYIPESLEKTFKTLSNVPVCFNHNENIVIGHNVAASYDKVTGITYAAEINKKAINKETSVPFAESIAAGDLKNVSIQCIYDETKSFIDEQGTTHAWVAEFVEMSIVTIPGFGDTTIAVTESLKKSKTGEKMKESKTKEAADETKADKPKYLSALVEEAENGWLVSQWNGMESEKKVCTSWSEIISSLKEFLPNKKESEESATLELSLKEMIAEHERLVSVLESGDSKKIAEELEIQKKELEGYKKQAEKDPAKESVKKKEQHSEPDDDNKPGNNDTDLDADNKGDWKKVDEALETLMKETRAHAECSKQMHEILKKMTAKESDDEDADDKNEDKDKNKDADPENKDKQSLNAKTSKESVKDPLKEQAEREAAIKANKVTVPVGPKTKESKDAPTPKELKETFIDGLVKAESSNKTN